VACILAISENWLHLNAVGGFSHGEGWVAMAVGRMMPRMRHPSTRNPQAREPLDIRQSLARLVEEMTLWKGVAMRVGIVGLGTIGRAMCEAIDREDFGAALVAVTTRTEERARGFLQGLRRPPVLVQLEELVQRSDVVIEAATQEALETIAPCTLHGGKDLMVLSVGALLEHAEWLDLARRTGSHIYVPSGAIVGLDGVKGAAIGPITAITMTTRKPPKGLAGAPYVVAHGIDLEGLTEETVIFEGSAREACRGFPTNVNISAALSLAGIGPDRTRIRIIAAPDGRRNVHDIEVRGEFGYFTIHLENVPSETNPRTGKLSYLSALAMLRELVGTMKVGT
jgi:aspartate dehydrogenase